MPVRRRSARPVRALSALLLAASLALAGCGASDDSAKPGSAAARDEPAYAPADAGAGAAADEKSAGKEDAGGSGTDAERGRAGSAAATARTHVARTASLTVRVEDVPGARDAARSGVERAGGYVGDETTTRDREGRERTRMVLRVPADRYQAVLDELEDAGTLLERSAQAEDVTDQVVDVESRIASQRASVIRVRELMERATALDDVVLLEGELSSREAELEALLARQAALKDRTELATVTLSLTETQRAGDNGDDGDDGPGFTDALAGGWDAFVTALRWLAVVCGALLPFAVPVVVLMLLWHRVVRPWLRRRGAPRPAAPGATAVPEAPAAPGATPGTGGLPVAPPVAGDPGREEPGANPEEPAAPEKPGAPEEPGEGRAAPPA
ncbi:DUF4349 domain-containing protein [Streptomyces tagetis]|uniref:DUF4349 domain-containing protein n=1 Tax=Streptomyces tagetis TaxID=2820809 RepID=A0A940XET5_9ACTN|nr:DUF4349 domain-containing protein [Streptomyces sp. RG38]MBQ0825321.1 DUF4349 domain-containing protein [Streptomyces sp. RG38]